MGQKFSISTIMTYPRIGMFDGTILGMLLGLLLIPSPLWGLLAGAALGSGIGALLAGRRKRQAA